MSTIVTVAMLEVYLRSCSETSYTSIRVRLQTVVCVGTKYQSK